MKFLNWIKSLSFFRMILVIFFLINTTTQGFAQTIDGSSAESFQSSLKKITDALSKDEINYYSLGFFNLVTKRHPLLKGLKGLEGLEAMPKAMETAHTYMDGVTKEEILEVGRKKVAQRKEDNRKKKLQELIQKDKQNQNKAHISKIRECLQSKVTITEPIIYENGALKYITMNIKNNLSWAISGIWVSYIIKSEGRSVPWDEDSYATSIRGGIEPGETRNISNYIGSLNDLPKDIIVTAEIIDVADPLKRLLFQETKVNGWADEKSPLKCE